MNPDFLDLLRALSDAEARFLVVGAYAVTFHAQPRSTGDLDLWVDTSSDNPARVHSALRVFGAPESVTREDLASPDMVVQIGVPPRRIDILTSLTGLEGFDQAWSRRVVQDVQSIQVPFLGREDLIRNKRAVGRPRDLADLELLGEPREDHPKR